MMNASPTSLDNAHALVTGGGSGIGAAVALKLSAAGARVSVIGRTEKTLTAILGKLDNPGAVAIADVTDAAAVEQALAALVEDHGVVDILVNNAGGVETAPFRELGLDHWDRMIAVNLTSVFVVTKAVLKGMRGNNSGRIVNIASTAGLKGYPYVAAYCAAKHGVVGLTRSLALELAPSGITVNAICPGYTDTGLLRDSARAIAAATGAEESALLAHFASANPQNRLIEPDEVASAVLWLCRHDARSMTGQAMALAGGEVM